MEINNQNSKLSEQIEDNNQDDFYKNLSEKDKRILDYGLEFLYNKQNNKTTNFINCNYLETNIIFIPKIEKKGD